MPLEFKVQSGKKTVEIWLTNAEKDNEDLRDQLKLLYQKYKRQGYLVITFQSGNENLADLTGALLTTNRRRMAEQTTGRSNQQTVSLSM